MGARRIYETYTPYPATAVGDVDFVQSADVMYFFHLDYAPNQLTRGGHTDWTWSKLAFSPGIDPPAGVSATPLQPNATGAIATGYTYYVTSVDANGVESRASTPSTATNDLSLPGNYNTITWTAEPDAASYNIYKGDNANPGYIGATDTLSFKDRNLIAVASDTPPLAMNPFTVDYPSTGTLYQQRLWMARTRSKPNGVWASQSAKFDSMDVSRPARPNDAISFALVSEQVNSVNQLSSLKAGLVALTADAVFSVTGGENGSAITPSAIVPNRESGRGSTRLKPLVIDNVLFYQPSKAGEVRTLGYNYEVEGVSGNNVAIFNSHLFKGRVIVCWAMQDNPFSCIWAVLDNGTLLCFTWEQEHEVWGWTKMEIDGFVEQCAVITEGGYDRLYILIRRTFGGIVRRFHERMALPHIDITTARHLDCAVTKSYNPPQSYITGLHHLEGETVSVHADGYGYHGLVVENGRVDLPDGFEAYIITAGLRYEGRIETLAPVASGQGGSYHVEPQNVGQVTLRCIDTRGLELSLDGETWSPLPDREGGDINGLGDVSLRDFEVPAPGHWEKGARLRIRQREPFPAQVSAAFYELVIGSD